MSELVDVARLTAIGLLAYQWWELKQKDAVLTTLHELMVEVAKGKRTLSVDTDNNITFIGDQPNGDS